MVEEEERGCSEVRDDGWAKVLCEEPMNPLIGGRTIGGVMLDEIVGQMVAGGGSCLVGESDGCSAKERCMCDQNGTSKRLS